MTPAEERQAIFKALHEYGDRYNADYFCVFLTPKEKGKKITVPGNFRYNSAHRGEVSTNNCFSSFKRSYSDE